MPLEIRNFRARQKNVLASPCSGLLLLDLQLHHLGWMLDDFGDVCPVTRTDFAENTLVDPNNTTEKPIALLRYISAPAEY
jgi:hypothetical protein